MGLIAAEKEKGDSIGWVSWKYAVTPIKFLNDSYENNWYLISLDMCVSLSRAHAC